MSHKKRFTFLVLACAVLLFGAREAKACECLLESRTVLDAYDDAALVVIARVASFEKAGKDSPYRVEGINSTRMVVEKVFKGGVKVGEEMDFRQGDAGECVWAFSEEMRGQRYLLYLSSRKEGQKLWYVFVCGRSTNVNQAIDDLRYLDRLDEVRGKTRISGRVALVGDAKEGVGRTIRIRGANKIYEVKTDETGFYEIYDLPAGAYQLEIETPAGWKAESYYEPRSYTMNFDGRGEDESPKKFYIFLQDRKHVSFDLRFEIDKTVRSKT
jgi:hypothetical protein